MRRKLAAGNWKMNGLQDNLADLTALAATMSTDARTDVLICPPAPLLHRACQITQGTSLSIGGQDCHAAISGAYTGDTSAQMIADTGATYVIVGHSERRDAHHESNADICAKAIAAHDADLTAIICIGESEAQREAGETLVILSDQLAGSCPDTATAANTVIAYEPIWAIGTGKVPTLAQIIEVHDHLRAELNARFSTDGGAMRLLYGGSVKPSNAATIFEAENVDGALVGGASLKATDFAPIVAALTAS